MEDKKLPPAPVGKPGPVGPVGSAADTGPPLGRSELPPRGPDLKPPQVDLKPPLAGAKPTPEPPRPGLNPPIKAGTIREVDADDFYAALRWVIYPLPAVKNDEVNKLFLAFSDYAVRGTAASFKEAQRTRFS